MGLSIKSHDAYLSAKRELGANERPTPGTPEFERHNALVDAIIAWEDKLNPDNDPIDPIEIIAGLMRDENLSQADLGRLFGSDSRASEIMNKRRRLTVPMIYLLNREWKIPADLLIQPYDTDCHHRR